MKDQFKNENLSDPNSIKEPASKLHVDKNFNDRSITKNSALVDFIEENLDIVRFVKVNSLPAVREHLTPKLCFDFATYKSVDE